MYESMYCNDTKLPSSLDKVDSVCDLLLQAMSQDKEKYILPIISCHVKSSKSKIDDALMEIKSLKGMYLIAHWDLNLRIFEYHWQKLYSESRKNAHLENRKE